MPTRSPRPRIERRVLDGVLLLDKPLGLSSNDALMRAKFLLLAKKAGHTGTLDPLASGLLPLCFGEATKFSQDLLHADKTYEATMRLGVRTTTGDAEGEAVETRPVVCTRADIDAVLPAFRGAIEQVPPMYSALKRDGKPLYEYARAGQVLERAARAVTIHSLEVLECGLPATPELRIRVKCSKGTYIRTLAEDIGERLGCGAHLVALRRTEVGALTLADAVSLPELEQADANTRERWLRPVDVLLSSFAAVRLDAQAALRFLQGQRLRLGDVLAPQPHSVAPETAATDAAAPEGGQRVSVYEKDGCDGRDGRLLGTAWLEHGLLSPERVIASRDV
jgi:tRNA pseudouridine55 synthase